MNSKLWIRKIAAAVLVAVFSIGQIGCGKVNLDKLQGYVDEIREHNKNILRVTNDFREAGKISLALHGGVTSACAKLTTSLNAGDASIAAARLVKTKIEAKSALDTAQRLLDVQVWGAFYGIIDAIIDVPPDVKTEIDKWLALIRLVFSSIRGLFAGAQTAIGGRESYV